MATALIIVIVISGFYFVIKILSRKSKKEHFAEFTKFNPHYYNTNLAF